MTTTTKARGYAVGSTVAINADLTWCWGAAANVIAEVKDARFAGGCYLYKLASVTSGEVIAEDVPADDLHPVCC